MQRTFPPELKNKRWSHMACVPKDRSKVFLLGLVTRRYEQSVAMGQIDWMGQGKINTGLADTCPS